MNRNIVLNIHPSFVLKFSAEDLILERQISFCRLEPVIYIHGGLTFLSD